MEIMGKYFVHSCAAKLCNLERLIGNGALLCRKVLLGKALDHDSVYIVMLVTVPAPLQCIGWERWIGQLNDTRLYYQSRYPPRSDSDVQ
jgi:hypothetical protein